MQAIRETSMDSFRFIAIGHLSRDPELKVKDNLTYVRIRLTGSDYEEDENGHGHAEMTHYWITAFGKVADTLATYARVGDQLLVRGRLREYTPPASVERKECPVTP